MTFGEKIRQLRQKESLTIKDLAAKSGLTAVTIISYEKNRSKANVTNIRKLANALNCEYEDLFELR